MSSSFFGCRVKTMIGPVAVIWKEQRGSPCLLEIRLPPHSQASFGPQVSPKSHKTFQECLQSGAWQKPQDKAFAHSLERASPFRQKVLQALLKQVPRGKVVTYGALARKMGVPGAARAVGGAMAANPLPLLFPCHRVIASNRSLGGFQGKQKGLSLKRKLLEEEGVSFDASGKVASECIMD